MHSPEHDHFFAAAPADYVDEVLDALEVFERAEEHIVDFELLLDTYSS